MALELPIQREFEVNITGGNPVIVSVLSEKCAVVAWKGMFSIDGSSRKAYSRWWVLSQARLLAYWFRSEHNNRLNVSGGPRPT